MKKSKGETIDLTYSGQNDKSKKNKKNKKSKEGKSKNNDNRINLNNEIIIGLTPKKEEKKSKKKADKKSKKQETKVTKKRTNNVKKKTKKPTNEKTAKRKKRTVKIFKWVSIIILIITCIILFMLSSVFNISEIVVAGNSKISAEEIISLSRT